MIAKVAPTPAGGAGTSGPYAVPSVLMGGTEKPTMSESSDEKRRLISPILIRLMAAGTVWTWRLVWLYLVLTGHHCC